MVRSLCLVEFIITSFLHSSKESPINIAHTQFIFATAIHPGSLQMSLSHFDIYICTTELPSSPTLTSCRSSLIDTGRHRYHSEACEQAVTTLKSSILLQCTMTWKMASLLLASQLVFTCSCTRLIYQGETWHGAWPYVPWYLHGVDRYLTFYHVGKYYSRELCKKSRVPWKVMEYTNAIRRVQLQAYEYDNDRLIYRGRVASQQPQNRHVVTETTCHTTEACRKAL